MLSLHLVFAPHDPVTSTPGCRSLFHGTGRLPPAVIYQGTVGFDPRCTREGNFYGRGVYFAEKASYVEGRCVLALPFLMHQWASLLLSPWDGSCSE